MSDILSTATSGVSSLTSFTNSLSPLTASVGQDWYTASNVFNPNSPQKALITGAGGNIFGATVSQGQLAPAVNSGLFSTVGMGGFSPLMLLIVLFILGVIGYIIIKHI